MLDLSSFLEGIDKVHLQLVDGSSGDTVEGDQDCKLLLRAIISEGMSKHHSPYDFFNS